MAEKKYHILAIDDEELNLEAIQRTLRNKYHITTCNNAKEALQLFTQNEFHLVLTDQKMPGMTGTELLAEIQNINPNPIRMVLSAYTEQQYLIDAINNGQVYRYITKPWEPSELLLIIQKAFGYYQINMDRLALSKALTQTYTELATSNTSLEQAVEELAEAREKLLRMEKLSLVGQMAGMIMHDLKQPLDIIRSAADTMSRDDLEYADRTDIADIIRFEVDRFMAMIRDLLEFSRGTFQMEKEEILLSDFFLASENRFNSIFLDSDIYFKIEPIKSNAKILVDRHHLQRAILNLLKNSKEAVEKDGWTSKPEIQISGSSIDDSIQILIHDNGPGIPKHIVSKLFQPFVTANKKFGFGLGLAIVKQIIGEHGGEINLLRSEKGTIFQILLPKQ